MSLLKSTLSTLRERDPLPPLYPHTPWRPELSRRIGESSDEALFGDSTQGSSMAEAIRCGLLVWNDDLEAAHKIAQAVETPTGSFWHAIIHRREGDGSNARYWWQLTGEHPAFARIYEHVSSETEDELGGDAHDFLAQLQQAGHWQPDEFVTACERIHTSSADDTGLRRIQIIEIESLLKWCLQRIGSL